MAITSGYFNSVNGDRKYNADQMSEYFEGIINEGVCQHIGGGLAVTAGTGLTVSVATGKAFIGQKWIKNDAAMTLTITTAADQARIDAVVLRRNTTNRVCEIAVKTGTPSASPSAPAMTRTSTTYEMALAYVNVAANATSVTVTDKRADTTVCGWATVAQSTSGEVDQMLNDMKTGFDGVVYSSPAAMVTGEDEKLKSGIDNNSGSIGIIASHIKNNTLKCVGNGTVTGTYPQNQYYPLTVSKAITLVSVTAKIYFSEACIVTFTLSDKTRSEHYASYQMTISESGTFDFIVPLPCYLVPGEYAITYSASAGGCSYQNKSTNPYSSDDYITNEGTVYLYGVNTNVWCGDVNYLAYMPEYVDENIPLSRVNIDNPSAIGDHLIIGAGITQDSETGDFTIATTSGVSNFRYNVITSILEDNFVISDFDISIASGSKCRLWLFFYNTNNVLNYVEVDKNITASGHKRYIIDLNHYVVYNDLDLTKEVMIGVGNNSNPCNAVVSNFKIEALIYNLNPDLNLYQNLNVMYKNINTNANDITVLKANKYLQSPNGSKFELAVSNDGTLHVISLLPNHTLFIGNSLLLGNRSFGMNASDADNDYYYHVKEYILSKNADATFDRLYGPGFESCTTVAQAEAWMADTLLSHLGNNVDLVIVQLGDNAGTEEKQANFVQTCPMLIQYIKEHAPNARVAWAGEWYSSDVRQQTIASACANKGAVFIDLTPLKLKENESYIGAVVDFDEELTLSYFFDTYTDDSANHLITLNFTVNNEQYTATMPYVSYTVSGDTISITSNYKITQSGGVANHPGNLGFQRIAEKMIADLGL